MALISKTLTFPIHGVATSFSLLKRDGNKALVYREDSATLSPENRATLTISETLTKATRQVIVTVRHHLLNSEFYADKQLRSANDVVLTGIRSEIAKNSIMFTIPLGVALAPLSSAICAENLPAAFSTSIGTGLETGKGHPVGSVVIYGMAACITS